MFSSVSFISEYDTRKCQTPNFKSILRKFQGIFELLKNVLIDSGEAKPISESLGQGTPVKGVSPISQSQVLGLR